VAITQAGLSDILKNAISQIRSPRKGRRRKAMPDKRVIITRISSNGVGGIERYTIPMFANLFRSGPMHASRRRSANKGLSDPTRCVQERLI